MKNFLPFIISTFSIITAFAQAPMVDINTLGDGSAYYQNFDGLAASGSTPWQDATSATYTMAGWYAASSNLVNYVANAGAANSGSLYSFGTGTNTDRALGSIASGTSNTLSYGVLLKNNTGSTVTAVRISYVGEQWRSANASANTLSFGYKTGTGLSATGVVAGFTASTTFDFASPNLTNTLAIDGNAAGNRTQISNLLSITLNPGDELFIRWQDINDSGNDQGLGLDSIVVAFHDASTLPVELLSFKAEASKNNSNDITWITALEKNNSHFEIERSLEGKDFTVIGTVKGNGNHNGVLNYAFTDNDPSSDRTNYYRLKQFDFDGKYSYSKIVSVTPANEVAVSEATIFPNPLNNQSKLQYSLPQGSLVTATIYDITGQQIAQLVNEFKGKGTHTVSIPEQNKGIFFIKVTSGNTTKTIRVVSNN